MSINIFKWGLALLLLFLLAFTCLWFYLKTENGQEFAKNKVIDVIERKTDYDIDLEKVDINIFKHAVLKNLTVAHGNDTLFSAQEVNAKVKLTELFNRRLVSEEILLKGLSGNFHVFKDGSTNFHLPKKEDNQTDKEDFIIDLKELHIVESAFQYKDDRKHQSLDTEIGNATIEINQIDIKNKIFDFENISLDGLVLNNTIEKAATEIATAKKGSAAPIQLSIGDIEIENTSIHNHKKHSPHKEGIDVNHLNLKGLALHANNIKVAENDFGVVLKRLAFSETNSQLKVNNAKTELTYKNNQLTLKNLSLKTPHSHIVNSTSIQFDKKAKKDFDFSTAKTTVQAQKTEIHFSDILKVVPKLKSNKFITDNSSESVQLEGLFVYQNNGVKGNDLHINLADKINLNGAVDIKNLNKKEELYATLNIEELTTSSTALLDIAPSNKLPKGFHTLGDISFKGTFEGLLKNFKANGALNTDIGYIDTDLDLSLSDSLDNGTYVGRLSVLNFQVGTLLQDSLIGNVTLHSDVSGSGFNLSDLNSKLKGDIDSITFKGYTYHDIYVDGALKDHFFDGNLKINDKNAQLSLVGKIDLTDSIPDFDAKINTVTFDLFKTNLSKKEIIVSAKTDLDFSGTDIDNIIGDIKADDIVLTLPKRKLDLHSVDISVKEGVNHTKTVDLKTSLVNGSISGDFIFKELINDFKHFGQYNLPKIWGILAKNVTPVNANHQYSNHNIDFDLQIDDRDSILKPLLNESIVFDNTKTKGSIDFEDEKIQITLNGDKITYKENAIETFNINSTIIKDDILLDLNIDSLFTKSLKSDRIAFNIKGNEENITSKLTANSINDVLNKIALNTSILDYTKEDILFDISNSSFDIDTATWDINSVSPISFKKGNIQSEGISIENFEQSLLISAKGKKVNLDINDISIYFINEFLKDERLVFDGNVNTRISVEDIFSLTGISSSGAVNDIKITGDDWGDLSYKINTTKISELIEGDFLLNRKDYNIGGQLEYYPKTHKDPLLQNTIDVHADIINFPFNFFDFFFGDAVENSAGTITGTFDLDGPLTEPNMLFKLNPKNVSTTVDYLRTRYTLSDDEVTMSNNLVNLTNSSVIDELGNTADIDGGFTHNLFKNFLLDVSLSTDNFLFLNTTVEDNTDYYGKGLIEGDVSFIGSFVNPDIDMKIKTKTGTQFNIPVEEAERTSDDHFITFVKLDTIVKEKKAFRLHGVNISMDIEVTEDAEIRIIFDEDAGDIITSKGEGDINIAYGLTGEFNVFGQYRINSGSYLFTYQDFINKPFSVEPGGTIKWSGDPYDAKLDIRAIYSQKAAPFNFIVEYLNQGDQRSFSEATNTTQVDLLMHITDDLRTPDINFDFQFPQVTGPIKSFTETKLRAIRGDQNSLNRQVFGLIVLGSFLPSSESTGAFGSGDQIITNTLSELVSNQISNYLTDILSEAFTDISFIDDVSFKVKYNSQSFEAQEIENLSSSSELEVSLQNTLLNQKLLISVGGNFDVSGGQNVAVANQDATYLAGDFLIEYKLTPDGRFRIKGYRTTDLNIEGRQNKTGIGLNYRKEFHTFSEFVDSIKSGIKKKKKKKKQEPFNIKEQ